MYDRGSADGAGAVLTECSDRRSILSPVDMKSIPLCKCERRRKWDLLNGMNEHGWRRVVKSIKTHNLGVIATLGWQCFVHPPYSPYLAQSDLLRFPTLNSQSMTPMKEVVATQFFHLQTSTGLLIFGKFYDEYITLEIMKKNTVNLHLYVRSLLFVWYKNITHSSQEDLITHKT